MEWIIAVIAFVVGASGGTGITYSLMKNRPVQVIETNKVIEKMVEVDHSLTDADLLKIPCSKDYMETNGEGLCREMFCRMNTRSGNQSNAATAKECEAIGNILNKKMILKKCGDLGDVGEGDETKKKACIEFFDRRL